MGCPVDKLSIPNRELTTLIIIESLRKTGPKFFSGFYCQLAFLLCSLSLHTFLSFWDSVNRWDASLDAFNSQRGAEFLSLCNIIGNYKRKMKENCIIMKSKTFLGVTLSLSPSDLLVNV